MTDLTPEPIMRIAMGFMAAKHLFENGCSVRRPINSRRAGGHSKCWVESVADCLILIRDYGGTEGDPP
jgi:hypothetical protein